MQVIRSISELQARADAVRAAGGRLGLVPTMGALHRGHLSLIAVARERADLVCVSIFVNPTQFDDPGDLAAYPRTWESDREACRAAGVDVLFAPTAREMYPDAADTFVEVNELSKPLCGATRPGHFRGVTTIVAKLLLAAKPHVAVFGAKDFQQLALIRRMVRDLNIDVEIVGGPTVREPDGLALSSRNLRLDREGRAQAVVLSRALAAAERAVAAGECEAEAIRRLARAELGKAPRARIDYLELRDPDSLALVPDRLVGPTLLALAVFIEPPDRERGSSEAVRLIDNRVLRPGV
jgi:pantoate--beta-alanine ligase